jgi:hypothetical protein
VLILMRSLSPLLALLFTVVPASPQVLHWYRGNTHTHTINSDGDSSPDAVVRWYREHDYQFLFITDHEYITDVAPLNAVFGASERFLVVPGQEITQWGEDPKRSSAHLNALFISKEIWPVGTRECIGLGCGATAAASVALADTFKTNIGAVLSQGGVAQVNHPNYRWSVKPSDLYDIPDYTLLEIWNGQGQINNLGGNDGAGDDRPSAEGYWDTLLSRGKVIWGVASDDSHVFGEHADPHGAPPGQAWIVARATELTPAAIKAALHKGDFYASTGITLSNVIANQEGFSIEIKEERPGVARYLTLFIGQGGKVLAQVAGVKPSYRFAGNEKYVRASITDSNGNRAWTQPVFAQPKTQKDGK